MEGLVDALEVDAGALGIKVGALAVAAHLGEDFAQTLLLLGAVGKDKEAVALEQIVFERLAQEVEILMEEGLRGDVHGDGSRGARLGIGMGAHIHAKPHMAEACLKGVVLRRRTESPLAPHLALYLLALHLGGALKPLGESLGGETLAINARHHAAHVVEVGGNEQRIVGHELQEGHALGGSLGKFGQDVYLGLAVLGQLVLDLKGTDGINLVAEEVDAVGILARVGIDVDDAAALGILTWLIDIVDHLEPQIAQTMGDIGDVDGLTRGEMDAVVVDVLLRRHHLGQSLWVGDHIEHVATAARAETAEHLGAQYLVGGIALAVAHGAPVARGEKEHALLAHNLSKIVVEIARLVGIGEDKDHGDGHSVGHRGKEQRRGRRLCTLYIDMAGGRFCQNLNERTRLRARSVESA